MKVAGPSLPLAAMKTDLTTEPRKHGRGTVKNGQVAGTFLPCGASATYEEGTELATDEHG